jgi:two-component system sensor histidine kinase/response regulator
LNENGKQAIINIKDQGPGISPKETNKIFGEFQKLSNKPTAGERSTGLDMAIVKKIVDGHKGLIRVESEIGKGTVFIISLPMNSKGIQSG